MASEIHEGSLCKDEKSGCAKYPKTLRLSVKSTFEREPAALSA